MPSELATEEAAFFALLDEKARILDTGTLVRLQQAQYLMLLSGYERVAVLTFLDHYAAKSAKRIQAPLVEDLSTDLRCFALLGTGTARTLADLLADRKPSKRRANKRSALESSLDATVSKVEISVEEDAKSEEPGSKNVQRFYVRDALATRHVAMVVRGAAAVPDDRGCLLVVPSAVASPLLWTVVQHELAVPGTLGTFRKIQMEAGMPVGGVDFNGRDTIVNAGLLGLLSESQLQRLHGERQISFISGKARYLRRVGLLLPYEAALAETGTEILSFPDRAFVGVVRGALHSPLLERPMAIAYVGCDVARAGQPLLLRVLHMSETGDEPSRDFVPAMVASLPFVRPRRPEEDFAAWRRALQPPKHFATHPVYRGVSGSRMLRTRQLAAPPAATPLEKPLRLSARTAQRLLQGGQG